MHQIIKKAFTLIELLVVIAIIGILSGLIVVSIGGMTQKATIAKAQVFSNSLRNSLMMSLISEWKFDGSGLNDGDTANPTYSQDSWSGSNNCSVNGTPKVKNNSNCISGSCLQLNGSTDYLDCGIANNLNFERTNAFTVSGWIKKGRMGTVEVVVSKQEQTVNARGWRVLLQGDNTLSFAMFNISGTNSLVINTANSFTDTNWNNFVFSYNGTSLASGVSTYINGTLSSVTVNADNLNATIQTAVNAEIGARAGLNLPFQGTIDDIRIFNVAMSTSQAKEQYYSGLNKLFLNGGITPKEYLSRINNYASNN